MSVMQVRAAGQDYADEVADEVRAWMARRNVTGKQLAAELGVSGAYVSRRMHGEVPWNVSELAVVARMLGTGVGELLPRLDSNQKPAGCGPHGYRPEGYRRGEVALAA